MELAFFNYYGKFKGILTPIKSKNIILRLNHYAKATQNELSLPIAKSIVKAKLNNQITLIEKFQKNYYHPAVNQLKNDIQQALPKIEPKTRASSLLGIEGSATVLYNQALRHFFRQELRFNGRNRQPPGDEVNALLSFGYVLLTTEYTMLLNGYGLDPYLGFFHGVQYGRPSLALDLIEPFRPVIDHFVITSCNLNIFQKSDFELRDGGFYLTQLSLKKFFQHWETMLNKPDASGKSLRQYLRIQVESLIHHLNNSGDFEPYRLL